MDSKDIRFSEKKIDDSWKDQAARDREKLAPISAAGSGPKTAASVPVPKTSKHFVNLLSSLGYQAMFHLGEIPDPQSGQAEVNLEAAKEAIDLLSAVKEKSLNNLSPEEIDIFNQILPELQLKFSQKA